MVSQTFLASVAAVLATASANRGKRGLAYNDGIDISGFPNSKVSWTYNWDSTTSANINYSEFIPMLWGTQSYHTNQWHDNVQHWLDRGTYRLLAFNEPDRPDQANMSPGDAVNAWRQYMEPYKPRAWLGAPAVSNGGYDWIRQFLDQCQGCHVDFIPVHWYNDHSQPDDLINWMNKICSLANSHGIPHIWLTEVCNSLLHFEFMINHTNCPLVQGIR